MSAALSSSLLDRLIRFYTVYAPDRLVKADDVAFAYAGRDEEVFHILTRQFGPEPSLLLYTLQLKASAAPTTPNSSSLASAEESERRKKHGLLRRRVMWRFLRHCPDRVLRVDDVLYAYRGREDRLIEDLNRKFGFDDDVALEAARDRLVRFYEYYNPEKVVLVDDILLAYASDRDTESLFDDLLDKYGPHPDAVMPKGHADGVGESQSTAESLARTRILGPLILSDPSIANLPRSEQEALAITKQRLIAFYELYAPEKVPHADEIILLTCGLWRRRSTAAPTPQDPPAIDNADRHDATGPLNSSSAVQQDAVDATDDGRVVVSAISAELFRKLESKYGPEPAKLALLQRQQWMKRKARTLSGASNEADDIDKSPTQRATALRRRTITSSGAANFFHFGKESAKENEQGGEMRQGSETNGVKNDTEYFQPAAASSDVSSPSNATEAALHTQRDELLLPQEMPYSVAETEKLSDPEQITESSVWHRRFAAFYAFYCPEKLAHLNAIVDYYKSDEATLLERLERKYGPEPTGLQLQDMERFVGSKVVSSEFASRQHAASDDRDVDGSQSSSPNQGEKRSEEYVGSGNKPFWQSAAVRMRAATVFTTIAPHLDTSAGTSATDHHVPRIDGLAVGESNCAAANEPLLQRIMVPSALDEDEHTARSPDALRESDEETAAAAAQPSKRPRPSFVDVAAVTAAARSTFSKLNRQRRVSLANVVNDVFLFYRAHSAQLLLAIAQAEVQLRDRQELTSSGSEGSCGVNLQVLRIAADKLRQSWTHHQLMAMKYILDTEAATNDEDSRRREINNAATANYRELVLFEKDEREQARRLATTRRLASMEEIVRDAICDQASYELFVVHHMLAQAVRSMAVDVSSVQKHLELRTAGDRLVVSLPSCLSQTFIEDMDTRLVESSLAFVDSWSKVERRKAEAVGAQWENMFGHLLSSTKVTAAHDGVPSPSSLQWMTLFDRGEEKIRKLGQESLGEPLAESSRLTSPRAKDSSTGAGPTASTSQRTATPKRTRANGLHQCLTKQPEATIVPPSLRGRKILKSQQPTTERVEMATCKSPQPRITSEAQAKLERFRAVRSGLRKEQIPSPRVPQNTTKNDASLHTRAVQLVRSAPPGSFSKFGLVGLPR